MLKRKFGGSQQHDNSYRILTGYYYSGKFKQPYIFFVIYPENYTQFSCVKIQKIQCLKIIFKLLL